MPHRTSIRKREVFIDRLTSTEVGLFVGVSARTIKGKFPLAGIKNSSGWYIYTVADACRIFSSVNGRRPRGSEVGMLLEDMGCDEDTMRLLVLRLSIARLCEHRDPSDRERI